ASASSEWISPATTLPSSTSLPDANRIDSKPSRWPASKRSSCGATRARVKENSRESCRAARFPSTSKRPCALATSKDPSMSSMSQTWPWMPATRVNRAFVSSSRNRPLAVPAYKERPWRWIAMTEPSRPLMRVKRVRREPTSTRARPLSSAILRHAVDGVANETFRHADTAHFVALAVEQHHATLQRGNGEPAVGKPLRAVDLIGFERFGAPRGPGTVGMPVEDQPSGLPASDQDGRGFPRLVPGNHGVDPVGRESRAALDPFQPTGHQLLQPLVHLLDVQLVIQVIGEVELGLCLPHPYLAGGQMEQPAAGRKVDSIVARQYVPHVGEIAILRRYPIEQRHVVHATRGIRREISEIANAADVDASPRIGGQ